MAVRIIYPTCEVCDPHRSHPPGAPHIIQGKHMEEVAGRLMPIDPADAKIEHRRASVRAAVNRLRDRKGAQQAA